jgi:hypothetical protein
VERRPLSLVRRSLSFSDNLKNQTIPGGYGMQNAEADLTRKAISVQEFGLCEVLAGVN